MDQLYQFEDLPDCPSARRHEYLLEGRQTRRRDRHALHTDPLPHRSKRRRRPVVDTDGTKSRARSLLRRGGTLAEVADRTSRRSALPQREVKCAKALKRCAPSTEGKLTEATKRLTTTSRSLTSCPNCLPTCHAITKMLAPPLITLLWKWRKHLLRRALDGADYVERQQRWHRTSNWCSRATSALISAADDPSHVIRR